MTARQLVPRPDGPRAPGAPLRNRDKLLSRAHTRAFGGLPTTQETRQGDPATSFPGAQAHQQGPALLGGGVTLQPRGCPPASASHPPSSPLLSAQGADWAPPLPPATCRCPSRPFPELRLPGPGGGRAPPQLGSGPTVSMTTRALQELDGGLGSRQAGEDLSTPAAPCPAQPQDDRAQAMPRLADSSSWPHDSQEPAAEGSSASGADARPKKTEKEPVAKVAPGPGKERLKAGATPRSPARRKAQASPPPQRPPPPPAPSDELPWGDLSLNKCLVLASLVALLGSAFQLCRDAVAGDADAPAPVPEPWVPPSSAPAPERASPPPKPKPKPEAWAPPAEAEDKAEAAGSPEAAEKAAGDERAPREPARRERPRRERPRRERPRAAGEPRGGPPRRWEAREQGRRPWARDPRGPGPTKRPAWDSPRRADEDRPPGRRKHRARKGRA
ncbi:junctional sarcoplasmic reticulum protein 1 [Vulpes lagopus]|uniref:junctional sarcoplasmic reticulum protein 1 n=1 Tax=Vulpes lagopus TaxID=494514 RepID=UPI001BC9CB5C|nr:junctional sarcoplasmic reticulum protein 1 [Vulpes lagopus]